jgi:hypothetical protein
MATEPEDITIPRVADGDTVWKVARWVLMLSHLYYDRNLALVDDGEYDAMVQEVAEHFDELPEHEQVMLGDPDEIVTTGSGMVFSHLIIGQAQQLARDLGEDPGPYTFKDDYVCDCCGCRLNSVRG